MPEVLYPGVFVTEGVPAMHPIDGVATSTAGLVATAAQAGLHAPAWTDRNAHDPGLTTLAGFAWLSDMLAYRQPLHPAVTGIAAGLGRARLHWPP